MHFFAAKNASIKCILFCFYAVPSCLSALDLDVDGMSDVWQRVHNIANGDINSDPDGDGQNNRMEAIAGTNPRDQSDLLKLLEYPHTRLLQSTFTWRSLNEKFYQIEESIDLRTWNPVGNITKGQGGSITTATFLNNDVPLNDSYASRSPASTSSTQSTGSNLNATTELGEPIQPPVSGRKTLWWSWSSATDGSVTITTAGSDFDTTLAIYSGTEFFNLVLLGANDDSGGIQSSVTFTAQAGVSYSIQVNSYGSNEGGSIVLNHPISSGVIPPSTIIPTFGSKQFFRVSNLSQLDLSTDSDSLLDWEERLLGTNPYSEDSDYDSMADGFEFIYELNPLSPSDANQDSDSDLLSNAIESSLKLNPRITDTDGNGISDANEDYDLDGLGNLTEIQIHSTLPNRWDTDNDYLPDGWEIQHGLIAASSIQINGVWFYGNNGANGGTGDPDADGIQNQHEYLLSFYPKNANTNGIADNTRDRDGDGIKDVQEVATGRWSYDSTQRKYIFRKVLDWEVSDTDLDYDLDGLTNAQEILTYGTDPTQPDTDDDGLFDGWEILNGYNALVDNGMDADQNNNFDADPDGDGLVNYVEADHNSSASSVDSDGDSISDAAEIQQGSDPNDPNSTQGPPDGVVPVEVTFGDPSGSHSEKYQVRLIAIEGAEKTWRRINRKYGQTQTDTLQLPRGSKFKVELHHAGTDPELELEQPDYDYQLEIEGRGNDQAVAVLKDDSSGILGSHNESDPFFAEGKSADLYIAFMQSETAATLPSDRKRKKLGVGEEVNLTLKPLSLPSPAWELTGTKGTSQLDSLSGLSSKLTAGERACNPESIATILGDKVKINFDVVEPSGVVMEQETGTGIWHIQGKPSAGFRGRPFITPPDVSFINIEIREGQCLGIGIGYYTYQNELNHPDGPWVGVISGNATKPSKLRAVDVIRSGADGPEVTAIGSFNWPIPWLFRVAQGGEKQFSIITHHHESDAAGRVTISKGGVSVSANINDPTTP